MAFRDHNPLFIVDRQRAKYKQAETAMREAELAALDGDNGRAMLLSSMATAYATMAIYDGAS